MQIFLTTVKKFRLPYRGFFAFYLAAALIIAVCEVFTARLTGGMSQAAIGFDTNTLLRFLGFVTVIAVIKGATEAVSAYFTGKFSGNTDYGFRTYFARHFIHAKFSELEKQNSGELLSAYSNDLPSAVSFITDGSLSPVSDAVTLAVSFIYMLSVNPLYTVIFSVMFPFFIFLQIKISTPIQQKAMAKSQETARFNATVNDSLQNPATIAAFSLEDYMERRYLAAYDRYYEAFRSYTVSVIKLVTGGILSTAVPTLIISVLCALSVINGSMSLAEFIAFDAVVSTAGSWLTMLSQNLRNLRVSAAGAAKLAERLAAEPEDVQSGGEPVTGDEVAVEFENVSLSYNGEVPALQNISFQIKSGERVAFAGGSGSGKSTLLKLLLGLYQPDSGRISVNGRDIAEISKSALRDMFAYVPQDSFLFPDSIRENIMCVRPGGNEAQLREACERAGILGFVENSPGGFDTVLSEAAENVSGGQRQRLAIARAFYKNAPAVLVDEGTSALDSATEDTVLEAMNSLMENRTVIMVAHRQKAINSCDRVIFLEKGRITEGGTLNAQ